MLCGAWRVPSDPLHYFYWRLDALRYDELSRIESVCFLYSIVASSGRPITLRIVSRICMHTLRESADRFQMERMSSGSTEKRSRKSRRPL